MKRIVSIFILMAVIIMGGITMDAKTTAKKKSSRTTQTAKKSSSRPAGAFAMVSIDNEGKLYLVNGGKVKIIPASWDCDGTYNKINGAYFLDWGSGRYGDNNLSLIYGEWMYSIIDSYYSDVEFWDYLWNNDDNLEKAVSFNPSNETVTYKTSTGNRTIKLSTIPLSARKKVTWF